MFTMPTNYYELMSFGLQGLRSRSLLTVSREIQYAPNGRFCVGL